MQFYFAPPGYSMTSGFGAYGANGDQLAELRARPGLDRPTGARLAAMTTALRGFVRAAYRFAEPARGAQPQGATKPRLVTGDQSLPARV